MEVTQQIIDIVEDLKFDEDLKQDFYERWLNTTNVVLDDEAHLKAYIVTTIHNLTNNTRWVENNRQRLRDENEDRIRQEMGMEGTASDPMDVLIAEQEVEDKLKLLSPLLRATLSKVVIEGMTVTEVAEEEGVTENVIYQRIHQARKHIEGEQE